MGYRSKPGLVVASVLLICNACASYPKVAADGPIQVKRGYWFDDTRFYQRGHQVDRGDAKDNLERFEQSASAAKRGQAFEILTDVIVVAGAALLGVGIERAATRQTAWPYLVSGGAGIGLSVGFAIATDGSYVSAVEQYNQQLGASTRGK